MQNPTMTSGDSGEKTTPPANRNLSRKKTASDSEPAMPGNGDEAPRRAISPATAIRSAAEQAQAMFPTLPAEEKGEFILIDPAQDEVQAFEYLMGHLPGHVDEQARRQLMKAYVVASYAHRHQRRKSGESYMVHPIAVTTILAELNLDVDTLTAGLLHDVAEDTLFDIDYLREQFGEKIAMLVDGVTKFSRINELSKVKAKHGKGDSAPRMSDSKAESLRKMFLAMFEDVRVVLIKLADRLHNMRTLGSQPKHKQRRIARETLDIFAPLANRLGIWQIKWELEDLSFRHVQPATYKELHRAMQQKRREREQWVIRIKAELEQALKAAHIPAEVSGRPKHIYSIWKKMQRKGVDFEQIYDIHGFRIIVENEAQCYAALGVVHSLWRPIPGEFDDYIANPKDNQYRSLHTAVYSRRGRPLEVQIRTREMHEVAELGIAAHWRYKEGKASGEGYEKKIAWLRQLMEWRHDVTDAVAFMDGMKSDVFNDRVYVFTPQGDVIDLPTGATPIDLAYAIHTELGHRCRGGYVNGKLVGLDTKLKNGDQVNIITAKRGGPSRDWLNPNLEYIATQRARTKIRAWLRKQNREDNIQRGRRLLEKELKRLSSTESFESVMKLFKYEKVDAFLAAIGYGEINSQQIAQRLLDKERDQKREEEFSKGVKREEDDRQRVATGNFQVQGVDGLLTHLGRCCNPVPGDPIIGYVTRGRGITVHHKNCPNIAGTIRQGREGQLIDVQWKTQPEQTFPVKIEVSAYDRAGLVRDVASLVADEHINMLSIEALTAQKDNLAIINATLDIRDATQLTRILTKIDRLPNIVEARRKVG
jgi:GTP pyrophosphokinase